MKRRDFFKRMVAASVLALTEVKIVEEVKVDPQIIQKGVSVRPNTFVSGEWEVRWLN